MEYLGLCDFYFEEKRKQIQAIYLIDTLSRAWHNGMLSNVFMKSIKFHFDSINALHCGHFRSDDAFMDAIISCEWWLSIKLSFSSLTPWSARCTARRIVMALLIPDHMGSTCWWWLEKTYSRWQTKRTRLRAFVCFKKIHLWPKWPHFPTDTRENRTASCSSFLFQGPIACVKPTWSSTDTCKCQSLLIK